MSPFLKKNKVGTTNGFIVMFIMKNLSTKTNFNRNRDIKFKEMINQYQAGAASNMLASSVSQLDLATSISDMQIVL